MKNSARAKSEKLVSFIRYVSYTRPLASSENLNCKMNFRKATENDVSVIVEMIADDELGKKRENFQIPLPSEYLKAFKKIKL